MGKNLPPAAYAAVVNRWHAALNYIRTMDQTRLIDTYLGAANESQHLQVIRAADAYDETTRTYRHTVAPRDPAAVLSPGQAAALRATLTV